MWGWEQLYFNIKDGYLGERERAAIAALRRVAARSRSAAPADDARVVLRCCAPLRTQHTEQIHTLANKRAQTTQRPSCAATGRGC